jgi:RHS repeat-associated protein
VLLSSGAFAQTTVSLSSPANNALFALPATIALKASATATAPNTIARVDFFANGALVGSDSTRAFAFSWVSPAAGTYTLTAVATDAQGVQTTSNPRTITVNAANLSPTVNLTAPANNSSYALPASVTLKATATAPETNDTVARVDFFANGTLIGSDTSKAFTITWTPTAGSYTLTAVATDGQGAQTTSNARTLTVAANLPPTVTLAQPPNNSSYLPPASITLKANATPPEDNDTVARVDFFANGTLIGSDTTKAFTITWDGPAPGTYTLTAVATDGQGAQTTSNARTVNVDAANLPPTVNLTSPANKATFAAGATIALKANASPPEANDTVARVDFFDGTTLVGSATAAPYTASLANAAPGTHTLTAVATDGQGAQTTSNARTITVTTGNQPPTVSFASPADGARFTAPATIALTANASDPDGTVASVTFFQGTTAIGTVSVAPFTFNWTNVASGSYALTAVATDNAGAATTSTAINITVTSGVAQIYYIVPDQLNTPRMIADQTGNTVWRWDQQEPFGASQPNQDPDGDGTLFDFPLRFPGQYFDRETSLAYNYFRDYDSTTGRYLESDPLESHGLSPYAYAKMNSLRFEDRFGLKPLEPAEMLLLCAADTVPDDGRRVPRAPRAACDAQDDCVAKCRCQQLADLATCYARGGSLNIPCQFRAKEQLEACLQGCAAKG